MARIYTRSGDNGETGLFGGQRVGKDDLRVEAYGAVDELNALLGVVRIHVSDTAMDGLLQHIQNDLFSVGSDLATPEAKDANKGRIQIQRVSAGQVAFLEAQIDHYEDALPPLTYFILPGGSASPLLCTMRVPSAAAPSAERSRWPAPKPISLPLILMLSAI